MMQDGVSRRSRDRHGRTSTSETDDGDRRAWRREDSDDQSNATARRQSLSVRERTGQGDNVQARKWRAGASSVRANRSSDDDQSRRKFKKERSESFHSENRASNVNKHLRAARIERARGGSREAAESYSRPNKRHHEGAGGKKGEGGGHKSGKGKKGGGKSEKKRKTRTSSLSDPRVRTGFY